MKFELYCVIDKEISSPEYEDNALTKLVNYYGKNIDNIPELDVLLDMITPNKF